MTFQLKTASAKAAATSHAERLKELKRDAISIQSDLFRLVNRLRDGGFPKDADKVENITIKLGTWGSRP